MESGLDGRSQEMVGADTVVLDSLPQWSPALTAGVRPAIRRAGEVVVGAAMESGLDGRSQSAGPGGHGLP